MRPLPRVVGVSELLDAPRHDAEELEQSLAQVAAVNRWLGGEAAIRRRLPDVLPAADAPASILDVGTGSGDLALRAVAWRRRAPLRVLAVDRAAQVRDIARRRCAAEAAVRIAGADARALPCRDGAFDAVLLSLVLHHFDRAEQLRVLAEAGRVARVGVLVAELERSRPALLGARLLAATAWRGNRLTRHDGPLSVRRAFTAAELTELATAAGLRDARTTRHPLFRLVLTARPRP